jgi:AraC-like DNA-binding protein
MFKPGQTCSFRKRDPHAKGYAIMFKEHFIDWRLGNANTMRDFSILNPAFDCVLFLTDEIFSELIEVAERMHFEYRYPMDPSALNILKLYTHLMIEKINRLCSHHISTTTGSLPYKTTQDFKSLVYQNIHKTKTVGDYAEMLCLTEKTLINHVRSITQTTPKDFINSVIVEESKAMLLNRSTVDQVASYFNFTDQAHFSNFFRNKTGQSPIYFKQK